MRLPLPAAELPESVRRFGAPDAPLGARTMAAKGLVPVKGQDLVTLLVQLAADADEGVKTAARQTLAGIPEGVLETACGAELPAAILDGLVEHVRDRRHLLEEIAGNRATADETVASIAKWADELICERIATDQVRLLQCPVIIEALYKNRNTRMSTVDRLVELAARNEVELRGIATFAAHVEAIQGQLIIDEPLDEPLESDRLFVEALQNDDDDDAIDIDNVDGSEVIKEKHIPLSMKIGNMSTAEKVRMCMIGKPASLALLVRDSNKLVSMAAISSPAMGDGDAARVAFSKQVGEDILRYIGNRRDWLGNYEVKKNLLFNPKTPMGVSMKFLSHMRASDLKNLARSKNVPGSLRTAATQRLQKKKPGG